MIRIRRAELLEVRLPLAQPFRAGTGVRSERRILLLRLDGVREMDGGGALSGSDATERLAGWSECVALEDPGYTSETTDTAWHVLTRYLLPGLPGSSVPEVPSRSMTEGGGGGGDDPVVSPADVLVPFSWIRGHPMAKSAVEMAAWDLAARAGGVSLAEALGGGPGWIPVGVSVGFQASVDDLVRTVDGHLSRGYGRVKVKIGPDRDLEPLRALRDRFGSELDLLADANGAYGLDDLARLKKLDAFGLLMIEQPLPPEDLLGHARVQEAIDTPICLDESLTSVADLKVALELGACRVANLKPGRMGGLGEARRAHDLCVERSVPAWCGGMLESGIGRAHNLALASLPGFVLPGDLSESARYWERDLVDPPFVLENGGLRVPEGPGMGVEPDRAWIEKLTVRRAEHG